VVYLQTDWTEFRGEFLFLQQVEKSVRIANKDAIVQVEDQPLHAWGATYLGYNRVNCEGKEGRSERVTLLCALRGEKNLGEAEQRRRPAMCEFEPGKQLVGHI